MVLPSKDHRDSTRAQRRVAVTGEGGLNRHWASVIQSLLSNNVLVRFRNSIAFGVEPFVLKDDSLLVFHRQV